MVYNNLLVEIDQRVAWVTINRPKALNALNPDTINELSAAIGSLEQHPSVKVIVLTGSGDKAFVAGADLALMKTFSPVQARSFALQTGSLFRQIENSPRVVIAAINGYALGGGCELAMACDLRLAAEQAQMGQPEINLGIIPGWGGTQRLPRLVGVSRAKEMMFTGEMVSAQRALQIGLVDHVFAQDELFSHTQKLAQTIASNPQIAIRLIKEAVQNGMEMDKEKAIRYEADLFGLCFTTEDQREGMSAFFEKRSAVWKDC